MISRLISALDSGVNFVFLFFSLLLLVWARWCSGSQISLPTCLLSFSGLSKLYEFLLSPLVSLLLGVIFTCLDISFAEVPRSHWGEGFWHLLTGVEPLIPANALWDWPKRRWIEILSTGAGSAPHGLLRSAKALCKCHPYGHRLLWYYAHRSVDVPHDQRCKFLDCRSLQRNQQFVNRIIWRKGRTRGKYTKDRESSQDEMVAERGIGLIDLGLITKKHDSSWFWKLQLSRLSPVEDTCNMIPRCCKVIGLHQLGWLKVLLISDAIHWCGWFWLIVP